MLLHCFATHKFLTYIDSKIVKLTLSVHAQQLKLTSVHMMD